MDIYTHEGWPPQHRAAGTAARRDLRGVLSHGGAVSVGLARKDADLAPARPSTAIHPRDLAASALLDGCPTCGAGVAHAALELVDLGGAPFSRVAYRCRAQFTASHEGAVRSLLACPAASEAAARRLTGELAETADFLQAARHKEPARGKGSLTADAGGADLSTPEVWG